MAWKRTGGLLCSRNYRDDSRGLCVFRDWSEPPRAWDGAGELPADMALALWHEATQACDKLLGELVVTVEHERRVLSVPGYLRWGHPPELIRSSPHRQVRQASFRTEASMIVPHIVLFYCCREHRMNWFWHSGDEIERRKSHAAMVAHGRDFHGERWA